MTRIGWIIVGILVYFLLGWILKDIVFSIITIEGDTTMGDILKYEQIVYSALTAIYIIIFQYSNLGSLRVEKRLNKKKANGRVFNDNISRSSRWFYLFTHS